MLIAVRWMLSKLLSPLWRTADVNEANMFQDSSGAEDIRHLRGSVVTQLCLDYGMIDDAVFFTSSEVLGGMPLKEGDLVNCIAVRGGAEGGWKALRVRGKACIVGRRHEISDSLQLRPLIGTVTSFDGDSGYINQTTYFSRNTLLEGYEPMKGDWVQSQYFINPTQWTTQAHSVTPLRYSRLDQVTYIVFGGSGVVEDSVFFSLSSLLLPAHYQPSPGDLVNLVMVESTQSLYSWRALCMAPCSQRYCSLAVSNLGKNESLVYFCRVKACTVSSLFKKTKQKHCPRNQGSETHTLKGCEFAGWDSEDQFTLVAVNKSTSLSPRRHPLHKNCSESSEEEMKETKAVVELNCALQQDAVHRRDVRGEEMEVTVSPGERLSVVIACLAKLSKRRLPNFLPNYPVPQALRDCVEAQRDVLVAQPSLGEVLSPFNMQSRFSALLWLEELHAEKELREFTISGALLRKGAVYLHLEVLGLLKFSMKRFLILLFVTDAQINDEDVSLRVNSEFHHSYVGEPLDVEFTYNRLTVRRCHNALDQTKHFGDILFPSRVSLQTPQWTVKWTDEVGKTKKGTQSCCRQLPLTQSQGPRRQKAQVFDFKCLKFSQIRLFVTLFFVFLGGKLACKPIPSKGQFFNPDLNPCQKEAVKRILAGECRPLPYMLFGPPGTGKTITLIEAILQVRLYIVLIVVLKVAPSQLNWRECLSVFLKVWSFPNISCFRVELQTRKTESIIEKPCCFYLQAGEDIRQAAFHRIVVSTCSSAGMFHNIGIQVGHFTHVFLDEAGQATEPESLIPISLLSERDGQIVLAGDPCQLGPVVKSKLASAFGLGVSLMERLMSNTLYTKHDWGKRNYLFNYNISYFVTKLIYNYRSHEALLALPSKLFYQGELCFKAPRDVVESLCEWKTLPKKGFPLIFHGVRGTEMREGNNPSWFNPAEAVQVMLYCCQLAKKLSNPVDVSDIGIIAPYRKQCEKIRLLLGKVGLSDIKVGSVEEFQGQEFLVIIMSTVRSNESVESADLQSSLGFLANPKRFNVAITRSKALFLVVGNPHILIRDPCFRALLQYCYNNGVYLGCDAPPFLRDTQMFVSEI
uniref:Mov10 like RISC complex RNA helicase 1 n=1 Tax=Kryptolebias marmoratus TaxID=37003 RepID=A0A3Q3A978_KRYMA